MYLPTNYKDEIHNLLNKISKLVNAADLGDDKKAAIYDKIAKLQSEIDRAKTRFAAVLTYWLDLTNAVGEGAKNLEPAVKLMGRVMNNIGLAKADHDQGKLEPPKETKKLPAPTSQEAPSDMPEDDEIPF